MIIAAYVACWLIYIAASVMCIAFAGVTIICIGPLVVIGLAVKRTLTIFKLKLCDTTLIDSIPCIPACAHHREMTAWGHSSYGDESTLPPSKDAAEPAVDASEAFYASGR